MELTGTPLWFWAAFAFVMGACTGSFCGVIIERVPQRQSIMGRSHCICGRQLSGIENIPIMSFVVLRGRARCCKAPIPAWYTGIEILFALWGAAVALIPLPWWARLVLIVGGWTLFAVLGVHRRSRSLQRDAGLG